MNEKLSDHGDRSGGLLIGYVGLITVPVACNCYAKAPEAAKAALAFFFDTALPQFKETANNVVFFAYKKHLTCIVSYLFVWYHSCIILIEGILTQC